MSAETQAVAVRILLVEDNEADVYLIRRALKDAGLDCDLTVFNDGAEAMNYLRNAENHTGSRQDLAVLDLNLPKQDGMEVLETLRCSSDLAHIPVVILTSSSSPRDKAKIEHLGIQQFFTKGPNLQDFSDMAAELKEILRAQPAQ